MSFLIFFSTFLILYFIVNLYVGIRLRKLFFSDKNKIYFFTIFSFFPLSFILSKILENYFINYLIIILNYIGSIYLGILIYLVLILFLLDLTYFISKTFKLNRFLEFLSKNNKYIKIFIIIFILFILIFGTYNAFNTKVKEIDIKIDKKINNEKKNFSILVASDIHLGIIINKNSLNRLVKKINEINPDLVFLPGDIIDGNLDIIFRDNLVEKFKEINSNISVYGILGNHEYISQGVDKVIELFKKNNIEILKDESILIDNSFYLIGRDDVSSNRMGGLERKNLEDLLLEIDSSLPKIVLDHQPYNLGEVANINKIDLQISGHTHNGQLWPFNYVIKVIYEIPYGYKRIENTHFVISSGFGFWGPPLRIGTRSEIVLINLSFE